MGNENQWERRRHQQRDHHGSDLSEGINSIGIGVVIKRQDDYNYIVDLTIHLSSHD